jgi:hypothetical protein
MLISVIGFDFLIKQRYLINQEIMFGFFASLIQTV